MAGSSSTDFWGVAHVPSQVEHQTLPTGELERRLALLAACWAYFDDTVERVSGELRPGARSAGRTREQIIRHVCATEPEQLTRKVEVRTPKEAVLAPDGLDLHRQQTLVDIREYHLTEVCAGRKPTDTRAGRTRPPSGARSASRRRRRSLCA